MTQKEEIERLGKWLGSDDCLAGREYLWMLSEQAAALVIQDYGDTADDIARRAREQVHAIIEMLEV